MRRHSQKQREMEQMEKLSLSGSSDYEEEYDSEEASRPRKRSPFLSDFPIFIFRDFLLCPFTWFSCLIPSSLLTIPSRARKGEKDSDEDDEDEESYPLTPNSLP